LLEWGAVAFQIFEPSKLRHINGVGAGSPVALISSMLKQAAGRAFAEEDRGTFAVVIAFGVKNTLKGRLNA
jgi:hypothetical protein